MKEEKETGVARATMTFGFRCLLAVVGESRNFSEVGED